MKMGKAPGQNIIQKCVIADDDDDEKNDPIMMSLTWYLCFCISQQNVDE